MAIANTPESRVAIDDDLLVAEVDECIRQAHQGCAQALEHLYKQCHLYLLLIANRDLDERLRAKFGLSDIVQETMLEAHRDFDAFAGISEGELRAWIRKILLNTVRDMARRYQAGGKRDARRERELCSLLSEQTDLPALQRGDSPSKVLMAAEEAQALRAALKQLPDEYQQVILLRNIERLQFNEIGEAMQRSGEAARKLWLRAIDRLRSLMGASNERS